MLGCHLDKSEQNNPLAYRVILMKQAILLLVFLAAVGTACGSQESSPVPKTNIKQFKSHVLPFLNTYCVKCHGAEKQRAKFALHDIDGIITNGKDNVRWEKILEMVTLNEMPPREQPQPTKAKRQQIVSWIKTELRKIGRGPSEDLATLPGQGNRVNHEALFSGEHKGPAFSKSRVWRISPSIYLQFAKDLTGLKKLRSPLTEVNEGEFRDNSILTADEATIRILLQNSKEVAKLLVHGRIIVDRKKNKTRKRPSRYRIFTEFANSKTVPDQSQMEDAVKYCFKLFLNREPTKEELHQYVTGCLKKNTAVGGNDLGIQSLLIVMMMSPEFLFRMEMGLGEELSDGRKMLSPREIAYALSFAINDFADPKLFKAAAAGKLATKADVIREVRRLLTEKDKRYRSFNKKGRYYIWDSEQGGGFAKPKLLRFFREFFQYEKAREIFKDEIRHKGKFRPDDLIRDADYLILNVLKNDEDVLARLLTTDEYFVNYHRTKKPKPGGYAMSYNMDTEPWDNHQIVNMPKTQRAGILTHPAWLAAFSTNFENDPVRRGKWIRERLLAEVIPEIPIGVAALLPDTPHETLRQRFEVVRKGECWRCHKKMNPLGEPFEMYDDFGRYRTQHHAAADKTVLASFFEAQIKTNKRNKINPEPKIKVDATGELIGTGDAKLDGKVENALDLVQRLAKSTRVRQSFIRHVFRYWMGRNETLNDSPTLMAMDRAYVDSNGSFNELLVTLLSSDSFLYRK